jgi:hypothetical protein
MRSGDMNPSTHSFAEAFEQRNAMTGWILAVALTVAAVASMWRCSEVLADAAMISHFRSRPVQAYVPSSDEREFKDFPRSFWDISQ